MNNKISIINRSEIEITGVKDVKSYDSDKIIFEMEEGSLTICGNGLNIKKLDTESKCVSVNGYLTDLCFSDTSSNGRKAFFTSLFK